jgi:hypothetical protein
MVDIIKDSLQRHFIHVGDFSESPKVQGRRRQPNSSLPDYFLFRTSPSQQLGSFEGATRYLQDKQ